MKRKQISAGSTNALNAIAIENTNPASKAKDSAGTFLDCRAARKKKSDRERQRENEIDLRQEIAPVIHEREVQTGADERELAHPLAEGDPPEAAYRERRERTNDELKIRHRLHARLSSVKPRKKRRHAERVAHVVDRELMVGLRHLLGELHVPVHVRVHVVARIVHPYDVKPSPHRARQHYHPGEHVGDPREGSEERSDPAFQFGEHDPPHSMGFSS
jgi:hypothetical protein